MADEKLKITGGQLRNMLVGGQPIAQYENTSFAHPGMPLKYRSEILKLPDGTFMEVTNDDYPDPDRTYGVKISEADALDKALLYSPQGAGAQLWSYFSDDAISQSLLAPIREAVKEKDSKSYQIDGNNITGDYQALLKNAEHIISYFEGPSDDETRYTIHKLLDGRFVETVFDLATDRDETASFISESSAIQTVLIKGPGVLDGYLRSVFSEEALDRVIATTQTEYDHIKPEFLISRLEALERMDFVLADPLDMKETLAHLHTAKSPIRIIDVLNTHTLDNDNKIKTEWDLIFLRHAEGLSGKFLQVKNIVEHQCNILRVLDTEEAIAAIKKLNQHDIIFSLGGERVVAPEGLEGLVGQVRELIEYPHRYLELQNEGIKRWPESLDSLQEFKEQGELVVKYQNSNSLQSEIYKFADNTFWEIASGINSKPSRYQVAERKVIEKFIDYPAPGKLITDSGLKKYFSESTIHNYKYDNGWDNDVPIEKINAYSLNADKAVLAMAANVTIVTPEGSPEEVNRFKSRLAGAIHHFKWHLTKRFSKGEGSKSSTFEFSLRNEFNIEATCKDRTDSFYCSSNNGLDHLYHKQGNTVTLLNSVRTAEIDIETPSQHLIKAAEQAQDQSQGVHNL